MPRATIVKVANERTKHDARPVEVIRRFGERTVSPDRKSNCFIHSPLLLGDLL